MTTPGQALSDKEKNAIELAYELASKGLFSYHMLNRYFKLPEWKLRKHFQRLFIKTGTRDIKGLVLAYATGQLKEQFELVKPSEENLLPLEKYPEFSKKPKPSTYDYIMRQLEGKRA